MPLHGSQLPLPERGASRQPAVEKRRAVPQQMPPNWAQQWLNSTGTGPAGSVVDTDGLWRDDGWWVLEYVIRS